jgi:hypothetical protein
MAQLRRQMLNIRKSPHLAHREARMISGVKYMVD